MIRSRSSAVWLIVVAVLVCPTALACEYSVRDAAFVCYKHEGYLLSICVCNETPAEVRILLEEAALVQCLDSNVRFNIVNADEDKDHPLWAEHRPGTASTFPFAILAAPDGRRLSVPLDLGDQPSRDPAWRAFEKLVASPARSAITDQIVAALNVVVLIEGTDAGANSRAGEIVHEAIDRIAQMMPYFPKPVHAPARLEAPTRLVTIARDALADEAVLLWSLGLDDRPADKPQVVVLHGRGRQIGWPLAGDEIDPSLLARILSISGQDCECDLPRSWMQGRLIPLRWDGEILAPLTRTLGFNPESPAVIDEVSRIVGAGLRALSHDDPADLPEISLGYNEIEIGFDTAGEPETARRGTGAVDGGSAGNIRSEESRPPMEERTTPDGMPLAMTCLLIAATVIVWGMVLVRRKRSGRRR